MHQRVGESDGRLDLAKLFSAARKEGDLLRSGGNPNWKN